MGKEVEIGDLLPASGLNPFLPTHCLCPGSAGNVPHSPSTFEVILHFDQIFDAMH